MIKNKRTNEVQRYSLEYKVAGVGEKQEATINLNCFIFVVSDCGFMLISFLFVFWKKIIIITFCASICVTSFLLLLLLTWITDHKLNFIDAIMFPDKATSILSMYSHYFNLLFLIFYNLNWMGSSVSNKSFLRWTKKKQQNKQIFEEICERTTGGLQPLNIVDKLFLYYFFLKTLNIHWVEYVYSKVFAARKKGRKRVQRSFQELLLDLSFKCAPLHHVQVSINECNEMNEWIRSHLCFIAKIVTHRDWKRWRQKEYHHNYFSSSLLFCTFLFNFFSSLKEGASFAAQNCNTLFARALIKIQILKL